MPNGIRCYEDWQHLTDDQRDFHLYQTLTSLDERLKRVSPVRVFILGLLGGAAAVAVCESPTLLQIITRLL